MKNLTIIRGVPGSGKSTLAKKLRSHASMTNHTSAHFEADMYFVDDDGAYHFDRKHLGEAHLWCKRSTEAAMQRGVNEIFVSNTFVQQWEINHYRELAGEYDYTVTEIICHGEFGSIHGVPQGTIDRMKNNFQYKS